MNDAQKIASALTYSKRYAFCNATGIMTGDEDQDGNGGGESGYGPPERPAAPRQEYQEPQKKTQPVGKKNLVTKKEKANSQDAEVGLTEARVVEMFDRIKTKYLDSGGFGQEEEEKFRSILENHYKTYVDGNAAQRAATAVAIVSLGKTVKQRLDFLNR